MIERNKFYRQTHQKKRDLASSQTICKDGFRIELPAECFKKNTGLMKACILKHVIGKWNKERVQYLVDHYGAVLMDNAEERSV